MTRHRIDVMAIAAIALAALGELFCVLLNSASLDLRLSIAISLIVVAFDYVFMIVCCLRRQRACSVLFFLVLLSIPFYYGQHILAVFNPSYLTMNQTFTILDGRIADETIISATFLIVDCLLVLLAGFLCVSRGSEKPTRRTAGHNEMKMKALKIASWAFLLISIYPTIRYLLALYDLQQAYTYLARRMLETQDNYYQILGVSLRDIYISGWFLPAVYGLYISYDGRKYRNLVLGLIVAYSVLYLLTGARFMVVKTLVSIFFIRFIWIKPITKSDIARLISIGVVLILVFEALTTLRGVAGGSFSLERILNAIDPSGMLWEPGITFTTVSNILACCPSTVDYAYGGSVLGSILQCLPDFLRFGLFDTITLKVSSIFSPLYYGTSSFGYGSSFIAEAYYNFGWFIYIVMLLYGLALGKIDQLMYRSSQAKSVYLFLVLAYLAGELVFGVRNDLSSIPRILLFGPIPIIVVALFLEKSVLAQNIYIEAVSMHRVLINMTRNK